MGAYNPVVLAGLITGCSKQGSSNHVKGEALADLVEYLFTEADGVELIERSLLDADGSGEIDFVFANNPFLSGMQTSNITIFVECKNEARKIGAAQVRTFASKLNDHNQPLGVMITTKGLSGAQRTHAHAVVSSELGHGRTIVVITLSDIANFTHSGDLVTLFRARRQELEVQRHYASI